MGGTVINVHRETLPQCEQLEGSASVILGTAEEPDPPTVPEEDEDEEEEEEEEEAKTEVDKPAVPGNGMVVKPPAGFGDSPVKHAPPQPIIPEAVQQQQHDLTTATSSSTSLLGSTAELSMEQQHQTQSGSDVSSSKPSRSHSSR